LSQGIQRALEKKGVIFLAADAREIRHNRQRS
jgi:hypothetical protein